MLITMGRLLFNFALDTLHRPLRVLWLSLAFLTLGLAMDGTWLRLIGLRGELKSLQEKMTVVQADHQRLRTALQKSHDPAFLERQARDHFDLVHEGDLLFIFSND